MIEGRFQCNLESAFFLYPYLKHRIFHLPYYYDFHGAAKSFSP